ncbi:hypothetical protein FNYG_13722 [Fusarium nygamai]|uniref:Uncharacterized protein n=1 Tax=Gibberella nygamai TaxID=42673 RepID=A0A2K0UUW7_GIBNY|nr:hypothetical protein FNYG_13722 [Fusarium nygamai]
MSTPPPSSFFELEMANEEWYHKLKDVQEANEMENAEQDTRLYEAQQTEQAVQDPDSLDESPEDATLWGPPPTPSPPSPPPSSPPPSQPGLPLPVPAPVPVPPVVTGGIEPQTTAPPAPFGPDMVANELLKAPQPKQPRAAAKKVPKQQAPKRVPNRVAKPPNRLSANQQQKQWDREGMARLNRRRSDQAAAKAAEEAAAMMASGKATQPDQLYGQNQFCRSCGQNLPQAAGPGVYYSQAAGPVYQQPPVPPAPFAAYAPAPAPALSPAPHLAPPPPPPPPPSYPQIPGSTDPGIMLMEQGSEAATWQPFPMPQQQAMYQPPTWYNMFKKRL